MNWTAFNGIILFTTLIVLLWYAYDTHRIANQTIESSLRPVILRTGQILDWKVLSLEDMKKAKNFNPTLEFTNNKNIATDISGYMIWTIKDTIWYLQIMFEEQLLMTPSKLKSYITLSGVGFRLAVIY